MPVRIQIIPKTERKIVYMYQTERRTVGEIAAEMPFSRPVVRRVLHDAGVKLRKRGTRREKRKKQHPAWQHANTIVNLYTIHKQSPRQLAKYYDASTGVIHAILKEKGVQTRDLKASRRYRLDKYGTGEGNRLALQYQINRLPDPLGKFIYQIHSEGGLPNCRVFAMRYNLPFKLVRDVSYTIRNILRGY